MRPARYIAGFAVLRVTSAEPERFLSELAARGVPFRCDEPPREHTMEIAVPARHVKRALAAAETCGSEAAVESLHGGARFSGWVRKRWPILLLLVAVFFLLLEGQARVWDITVEGNETIPDGVIRQAAAECGVTLGARWTGFSQDSIRTGVMLRVPELRWMTVTMQGSRAHLIVREKYPHDDPVNETEPSAIVATKAGLITDVQALHGTAVTEENRAVLPGETLIAGYTTGRFGIQGATWAAGSVRARTWYELTTEAPSAVAEKVYTGQRQTRYALIVGENRINFYKDSSICPPGCDKIIERIEARREGAYTLPVAIERITTARYETVSVPAEELREELEAMLMKTLLEEIGEDGEILSASFTASEEDGVLRVTLHAECAESIGVIRPLTEAEIEEIASRVSRDIW